MRICKERKILFFIDFLNVIFPHTISRAFSCSTLCTDSEASEEFFISFCGVYGTKD